METKQALVDSPWEPWESEELLFRKRILYEDTGHFSPLKEWKKTETRASGQFIPNEHNSTQKIQVPGLILMTTCHLQTRQDSEPMAQLLSM